MIPQEALTAHIFWKNHFPDYKHLRMEIEEKDPIYFWSLFHNLEPETIEMIEEKGCGEDVIASTRFLFRYMEEFVNVASKLADNNGHIDTLTKDNLQFYESYVTSEISGLPVSVKALSPKSCEKCAEKLSLLIEEYLDFEKSGREDLGGVKETFEAFITEAESSGKINKKQKEGLLHLSAAMNPLIDHHVPKEQIYPLLAAPVMLSYIILLPITNSEELINIITASLSTYVGYLL